MITNGSSSSETEDSVNNLAKHFYSHGIMSFYFGTGFCSIKWHGKIENQKVVAALQSKHRYGWQIWWKYVKSTLEVCSFALALSRSRSSQWQQSVPQVLFSGRGPTASSCLEVRIWGVKEIPMSAAAWAWQAAGLWNSGDLDSQRTRSVIILIPAGDWNFRELWWDLVLYWWTRK